MDTFMRLVKVSLWNTNGTQYLSKNPPHTGRVKTLLEMFPNAKFIYLKRNPYTVFESTRSFFTNTIQPLRLQDITNEQIEANFIEVYRRLFYKYEEEKHLIPEGNLVEVKFEDFEKDAFAMTENIYGSLNLPGFKESKADIEKYLGKKKGYKVSERKISIEEIAEAYDNGKLDEVFGTGTAAVISPVGKINDHGKEICFPSGMEKMGPVIQKLYDTLTGIQMGRIEAPKGWIHVIE